MEAPQRQAFPWRLFLCELSGTAVLVLVGLSLVIGMFGTGSLSCSPVPPLASGILPDLPQRAVAAGVRFVSM